MQNINFNVIKLNDQLLKTNNNEFIMEFIISASSQNELNKLEIREIREPGAIPMTITNKTEIITASKPVLLSSTLTSTSGSLKYIKTTILR